MAGFSTLLEFHAGVTDVVGGLFYCERIVGWMMDEWCVGGMSIEERRLMVILLSYLT